jgi:mono/diheme cytochrome c family protein
MIARDRGVLMRLGLSSFALLIAAPAFAAEPPVDFARDIRPIFARHCFECHGPKEEEGGLRLDERKRVLEGGASGPALVPGKSAESLIYQFITGKNEDKVIMPPKGRGERLSDAQCELVRRWIDAGAPWPQSGQPSQAAAGIQRLTFVRPGARLPACGKR